jgi:hypothetical protein
LSPRHRAQRRRLRPRSRLSRLRDYGGCPGARARCLRRRRPRGRRHRSSRPQHVAAGRAA